MRLETVETISLCLTIILIGILSSTEQIGLGLLGVVIFWLNTSSTNKRRNNL